MRRDAYWRAVVERDAQWNDVFVYAVRSTGVYCRPSCPARRPERERVVFFRLPQQAEQAGYRPCRRCRPREAFPGPARWVERLCRLIDRHQEGPLTLAALSAQAGISPHHLQKTFQRLLGISPRQYAEAIRLRRLKTLLRQGQSVTASLYEAGYGSSSRLYERSNAQLGMTPASYRRGGGNMEIAYTIVDCPLGRLLVAGTERGISAVSLGNSDAGLEKALRKEYPNAQLHSEPNGLKRWVTALVKHLNGRQRDLQLPLDVEATAFQWQVWEKLRAIPYGSTSTYSEVARAVGRPAATRAVARACATNPVSLVIPCHRVIRQDGGRGGYRWGLDRKEALLELEKRA